MTDRAISRPIETRSALLRMLAAWAEGADAVRLLWLQGSLAAETADPWSDIDAYVAIADDQLDAYWLERETHLADLGGALAWSDATTPGMKAVHALMPGGVRLDLFYESASRLDAVVRPFVKMVRDKDGLGARLKVGSPVSPTLVGAIIRVILRMTRQGSTWPLRLLGRGEWATLAMMELDLINAQLAQLMAVARDPANFYVNPLAVKARLSQAERRELDDLSVAALAALGARDAAALAPVHLAVFDALGREGRRACTALGTPYPIDDAGEAAIRTLLVAEWPS